MTSYIRTTSVVFGAIALFGTCVFADDGITIEKYPDADVVLVKSVRDVEFFADGTHTDRDENWVKILTEKGRRDESEITMAYSSRYGGAEIVSVGIIGTNGVERTVDISSLTKDSTDNSSMEENIYDPMHRKLSCSVPGLMIGETIHVALRRWAFMSRVEGQFADMAVFEWQCPILDSTYRVTAPKDLPLRKMGVRNPLGNISETHTTNQDGRVVHTWRATNSPQAFEEPNTPPLYSLVENVQVSTASSWDQLSRWYWGLSLPHLAQTNEAISNKVASILESADGFDSRVRAIYKWVAQEIRYMGLTMEDTSPGYAPHDVDITFDNRYGVCRDKAALLVAMLRIAGIEAYPVLIHNGVKKDPEVPSHFFNHAIVAVANPDYRHGENLDDQHDGKYILMDPTDESSRDLMPAYLSNCSYLVARPDGETLRTSPIPPADPSNALVVEAEGILSNNGSILLKQKIVFNGVNDNTFRQVLLRRKPEARRKTFETILRNRFPGVELMQCEIAPADLQDTSVPLTVNLISRITDAVSRGDASDELDAPLITPTLGASSWILAGKTSLESRKYPLVVDSTASAIETLRLRLEDAVGKPLVLPADRRIEGKYEYERTFRMEGNELVVCRRAAVNDVEFSPEEYANLREILKNIEASERERPSFAINKLTNANVRYRVNRCEVDLDGDSSWTVTNTIEKEILTYDGKKNSSELKFAFNPTWEDIEILEAVVSNPDGRVAYLNEREVNVMDCSWAASAPRYPASKQMVVNLPSVEIGSTIRYVIKKAVRNAPAPFCDVWAFDVFEPTDELTVRVNGLVRTERNPRLLKVEPMAAPGDFWRDLWRVSSNDFSRAAAKLRLAADVKPVKGEMKDLAEIRDWMVKHVRIAGPTMYELPIEAQLTDPRVVLKERYATRLDFIRTMCALLRGAGYEADIVFSSADGAQDPQIKEIAMTRFPDVRQFAFPICRVREYEGGWLWGLLPFGRTEKTVYVGTENEYTPVGLSSYAGSHYFDPETGKFEFVTQPQEFNPYQLSEVKIAVRENCSADFDVQRTRWGSAVGAFRKTYEEMLPEDRSRHLQGLLGSIAQAASATSELSTDTESYPAKMSFSCYVPSFATAKGDSMTIVLPDFYSPLFPLTGVERENPVCLDPTEGECVRYTVTFPAGYTVADHLPRGYTFRSPLNFYDVWYSLNVVTSYDAEGRLVVDITRTRAPRIQTVLATDYFGLLKEWSRLGSSRPNRTIIVRRPQ